MGASSNLALRTILFLCKVNKKSAQSIITGKEPSYLRRTHPHARGEGLHTRGWVRDVRRFIWSRTNPC